MNELALFAGAGGGILGGLLLGWRTVCAVELDAYARDVLVARQNDGCLPPFPIWDDIRTFDGTPWRERVDVVSGGFPCQDISAAGKGAGITGARSGLWAEMARVIGEVRPRYAWVENSPMLVGRGLGMVLADLAQMGFDAEWGVVGADDAGAPHRRDRIWILAHDPQYGRREGRARGSDSGGQREREQPLQDLAYTARDEQGRKKQRTQRERTGVCGESIDVPDANGAGREERRGAIQKSQKLVAAEHAGEDLGDSNAVRKLQPEGGERTERGWAGYSGWWESEPDVGRVAHGVAARVDRLRCLGNGQVPAVVRLAHRIISARMKVGT
jgi:DNA (cytosine-5)-methyltransferase 1